jgi:uncharacterized membrane protein
MSRKSFLRTYVTIIIVPFLMVIFPIFEIANKVTPFVLGLPFNFFWIVLWIVITFIAVVFLYFKDPDNKKDREG